MQNRATGANGIRAVFLFTLHQLISTIGVVVVSGVLAFAVIGLVHTIFPAAISASWLLTEVPGFPVQVFVGIVLGFLLERVTRSSSALWVWILPSFLLCIGALVIVSPTSSILQHLFGSSCKPAEHCFDSLLFTLPFIASIGYSAGAVLARTKCK